MKTDVWKTIYTANFDDSRYIYHYTNVDKAIKIIDSNSLRFSCINNTNDTSEAKLRINFELPDNKENQVALEEFDNKTREIVKFFQNKYSYIRLMCFSMDVHIKKKDQDKVLSCTLDPEKEKYYNMIGRGFALPRMWAQYASDNKGVCFIINKNKLLNQIAKKVEYYIDDSVDYKPFLNNHFIKKESLNKLYEKITSETNDTLVLAKLFSKNSDFIKYNYFEKLDDWKSENEYRIVALTNNDTVLSIGNFKNYTEGVVLGEKIDPAYENVLKLMLKDKCEIKKISFESSTCVLK